MEAIILSGFILMRQNRMMRRGERRDHLNLQVELLAEKEITKCYRWYAQFAGIRDFRTSWRIRKSVRLAKIRLSSRLVNIGRSPAREVAWRRTNEPQAL